jgi:ArsR family transcriptional regulator, arsenate/arsenite/antimonite-responsive transcriptional repressor
LATFSQDEYLVFARHGHTGGPVGRFPRALFSVGLVHCQAKELTVSHLFYISRNMDTLAAVSALSALAQESRLKVFRLLIRAGSEGMAAGDIARTLGVPHNTMSAQLAILSRAELVQARKEGRSVIYTVNLQGTRALLFFLVEDCCRGEPSICAPLIESALDGCGAS